MEKCYPYPLILRSVKKKGAFAKEIFWENQSSYRPENLINCAPYISP